MSLKKCHLRNRHFSHNAHIKHVSMQLMHNNACKHAINAHIKHASMQLLHNKACKHTFNAHINHAHITHICIQLTREFFLKFAYVLVRRLCILGTPFTCILCMPFTCILGTPFMCILGTPFTYRMLTYESPLLRKKRFSAQIKQESPTGGHTSHHAISMRFSVTFTVTITRK
jgi:hypothetical protein